MKRQPEEPSLAAAGIRVDHAANVKEGRGIVRSARTLIISKDVNHAFPRDNKQPVITGTGILNVNYKAVTVDGIPTSGNRWAESDFGLGGRLARLYSRARAPKRILLLSFMVKTRACK